MRLIDADKLYPDCLTKRGTLAISQSQIANAPTVDTYTEDDVQYAIKEGHQVGYEMAKAKFERPQGEWLYKEFDAESGISRSYWCSNCGEPKSQWCDDFCQRCGAYMRKEAENE